MAKKKSATKTAKKSQLVFMSNLRDALDKALEDFDMAVSRQVILEILLETYLEEIHPDIKDNEILTIYELRDIIRKHQNK